MAAVSHVARDGREALQAIVRLSSQEVALDLVVLDLNLPQQDGFRVLEHLQGTERLRDIPVLVLTGSALMEHVERCFRLGADAFLWKPAVYNEYQIVASRIAELLESPTRPPRVPPTLSEREALMWNLNSPEQWAGTGG
jgi:CheY-like chemotaxis protein